MVFWREMMEIKKSYNLIVFILLEPEISGERADEICRKLGKSH